MGRRFQESEVNRLVDAVYVLSVRSFADRIAHIEAEMTRHRTGFEFIFEFDANAIPVETLAAVFAPSDMTLAHQSLVLKHIETWRRRVLVFEDDAVLADGFADGLNRALPEADRLAPGWLVYLGCADNRLGGIGGDAALVPSGELPATDALIFDAEAALRRLRFIASHRITRPADWLTRETDAAVGVRHFWLREPLVEQGSMNGMFASVLDEKRRNRGRWYSWARFRWDRWWKRMRRDLPRPS
jgi:glycosyl transferase family 25